MSRRVLGAVVLLAILAAVLVFRWTRPRDVDMTAVLEANLRGVGLMEQFEYAQAAEAFEKVTTLAPEWTPGRINLGIALLNYHQKKENLPRAVAIFEGVLKDEPDNVYAHFCLGILHYHLGQTDKARPHFARVTQLDPNDAHSWHWLAMTQEPNTGQAREGFKKALEKDPSLGGALYGLAMEMRGVDPRAAKELLEKHARMEAAGVLNLSKVAYSGMGKYAEVIGRAPAAAAHVGPLPKFDKLEGLKVTLPPGTRWASSEAIPESATKSLFLALRQRFGAALTLLDYDGDGKSDLYIAGAVVENGRLRDLLLRNEGPTAWRDVTAEAGLGDLPPSIGAIAGDYDNDGRPDLLLTGAGRQLLLHNEDVKGSRRFLDVSDRTPLAAEKGICLGAAFVDLDQDGDLDLVICRFARDASDAQAALKMPTPGKDLGLAVLLNAGEAAPGPVGKDVPLTTKFIAAPEEVREGIAREGRCVNVVVADIDRDRDVDMIVLQDGQAPLLARNDRLLRFQSKRLDPSLDGLWNGGLILDVQQKELSDVLLVGPVQRPRFIGLENADSPPLLQALAADIDLDGLTDVVGLAEDRRPVLLRLEKGALRPVPHGFDLDSAWPKGLQAVAIADVDDDYYPDLVLWDEGKGLSIQRNLGNGNRGIKVEVTGRRQEKEKLRCNADGIGVKVRLHARELVTGTEIGTLSASLGNARQPLLFGLGKHALADVIRVRWPDGTWQAELAQPAGHLTKITQINRMPDSCPLLFTFDGERFTFICDFLGGGALGEAMPDRSHRQPRPEESIKIETHQLRPKDGMYNLKIAEPMDEVTYLDRLQLVVIDHAPGTKVYPEERFASVPPSQALVAFEHEIHPANAVDHRGQDVTATLLKSDRVMVDGFARRSWLGFAEEHWVELDFGDRLAKFGPEDRLFLCLVGWTDYPYPEAMWAAEQAGVPLVPPTLERRDDAGSWQTVLPEMGFPAGRPRMMMVEVTGKLLGSSCRLRIRTNMQVFWDQVFVALASDVVSPGAVVAPRSNFRMTPLAVHAAHLTSGATMQEYTPDGKQPTLYNFHKSEATPVSRLAGALTRFGDVAELLHGRDDRFVVFGPGDELSVSFSAATLPALRPGWSRSFVLRTWGYCKSHSPFTATSETVEPLPFQGMSAFPYGVKESFPQTPMHVEYLRKYQTRIVGPR